MFDYPTIGGLAEYLAAKLPDAESDASKDAVPAADLDIAGAPESDAAQQKTEVAAEPR